MMMPAIEYSLSRHERLSAFLVVRATPPLRHDADADEMNRCHDDD